MSGHSFNVFLLDSSLERRDRLDLELGKVFGSSYGLASATSFRDAVSTLRSFRFDGVVLSTSSLAGVNRRSINRVLAIHLPLKQTVLLRDQKASTGTAALGDHTLPCVPDFERAAIHLHTLKRRQSVTKPMASAPLRPARIHA
ncbi:MAG: hypothetical protein AAFY73_14525 [Pseudomonadota bacterium]